ncbi:hypothetical protein [Pontibacillus marinus]|uniref:Uncharacterized protein n=2 Tax=Pontibacillus TaxID=289201 RepID=A0A0A5I2S3_9BACI|nr:hypothetical protein [Pontibacillus marinus]KGX90147.1 hypothetical protein N783_01255 [Pontibacillus marinus BH030004 = DSM 16465]
MVWEEADGSGKPIELTPREYFDRFVYNQSFEDPDEILVNEIKQRGNTKNNIKEAFPNSHVVEFYRSGTEENGGMDLGKY